MKFYKYVTQEVAKIIIRDGTLKFTSPINFNDPFDYHPAVLETGFKKFAKRLNTELGQGIKRYKTNHRESLKHLQSLRSERFREIYTGEMSVSCFSESPYILPMWAHYADNHKGCVIEFEFNSDDYSSNDILLLTGKLSYIILVPFQVNYSPNRPPLYDNQGRTDTETTGFYASLTKSKEWEYEKELRVIIKKPEGVYSFERNQMTGIYVGMKVSSSDKKEISRLVDSSNNYTGTKIKKHDIVMAYDKFELTKIPFRM
ncbi:MULTISPECIES: DUF2971 domain-containing protein [Erwiniaceae]|uniref:DUF2971 domain-containing protein n=1 Tax=Pantoea brenneri TaxID=472694 RepID=A0ABU9MIP3_9GAMM|nr:DUF2971 domain-containing protein [Pantoea sp. 3.5.1]